MPVGGAESVPVGSADLGPLAGSGSLDLDVVLAPRHPAALSAFIGDLYDPSSPQFHHFLAKGQFASEFGPTQTTIGAVESALTARGLEAGRVSPDGLVLPISTTVGRAESAFGVHIDRYRLPSGRTAFSNASAPLVPSAVKDDLVGVVGLSDVEQEVPLLVHASPGPADAEPATALQPATTGPTPCSGATTEADSSGSYTANELADAYGFDTGAYGNGHFGAGETVALFELEPNFHTDVTDFETCYGTSTTVNYVSVDGGPTGSPGGADDVGLETSLDIENVIGLAPDVTIDVYQAPNTDAGVLDDYSAIADADTAQAVSTSWGECEASSTDTDVEDEEAIFEQMATQGQSIVAAAGDSGSEGCYLSDRSHALSVWDPSSDPYVTGVGGTSLTSTTSTPPTETVWNDGSHSGDGAGGGGISAFWTMPSYQQAVGVNADSSGTPCAASAGSYCREVPDVSASANPEYGYVINYDGTWTAIGGTSGATPLWAALTALADEGCSGRAGLLNPALYSHESDLNDITSGNNDYTASHDGLYPATVGYDMASGLGTPTSALFSPGVLCAGNAADGTGTMVVVPTSVTAGSTGNTLTFTYTAATGGTDDGEVTVAVPSGWPAPTTSSGAGYTTSDCGSLAVSSTTIEVSDVDLSGGVSCTITYGSTAGSGPGATAPSSPGQSTFATEEESTASGTLTPISSSPAVDVTSASAPDGTGTMVVSPTSVTESSTGNTLTFTYTAATGGTDDGEVTVAVPSGWSAPTTSSGAGYTTSSCGSVAVSSMTIEVPGVTLSGGGSCTVTYSSATAPSSPGQSTFATEEESTASGTLTPISSSPAVDVTSASAPDGTGTMVVSPTSVTESSTGNTLTFTYTAATGGTDDGETTVAVPSGWSAPTTSSGAGYTTSSCGSVAVSSMTIEVPGVTLSGGGSCTVTYSSATAPSSPGDSTFATEEESTTSGTLTPISSSPAVDVTSASAPDGTGTMVVVPTSVTAGSSGNTLTFTYRAASGGTDDGEVTVAVPSGWSAPSLVTTNAGYTTSSCGSVAVSSMTIEISGVTLSGEADCTITYGSTAASGPGADAPPSTGDSTFATEEESTASGTLTAISSSPTVDVTSAYAADGTGTMVVVPTSVTAGSTGDTLTFTYTAATGGTSAGKITVAVPSGWSAPSTSLGYSTSTCGMVTASSTTIEVSGVTLSGGASCTITYGSTAASGPGANAPPSTGDSTFVTEEESTASGALAAISSSPTVDVTYAPNGSGTVTVSPTSVTAGSAGDTLTFTYTAATGGTSAGKITVAVPSGWSAPSTSPASAGYSTSNCGTVAVSSTTIEVSGVTLSGSNSCTVTYGAATATSTTGNSTFVTDEESSSGGSLLSVTPSPQVDVTNAPDGSGTMTASPSSVVAGSSGNTLTFDYTAATGGTSAGKITVAVPSGWSAPSTSPASAGYTTSSCGSVAVSTTVIEVTGVTLGAGGSCTITYRSATAPVTPGDSSFSTEEESTAAGTLTPISSSPAVAVSAAPSSVQSSPTYAQSTTSVVLQPDGSPSVFFQGASGSLWNYWYASGTWDRDEVAGGGVASPPVVVLQPDGSPSVFFQGAGGSLWNYWYSSGVWYSHEIAPGGVASTPAVVLQQNGAPSVFFEAAGNSLMNDWYIPSPGIWGSATVAGAGSDYSSPAVLTQESADGAPSVFVEGPGNSLYNYWYIPAQGTFGAATVAGPGSDYSAPGVVFQTNGAPSVFVEGPGNSLYNYWYIPDQGTFGAATVAGPGSAYSSPTVALQADGAPTVFDEGPGNSLYNYWYIPAQGAFGAATVAGTGQAFGAPAVTQQPDGAPSVFFEGPADTLWNYWYVSGTWDSSPIAGDLS